MLKHCKSCGEDKDISLFSKDKNRADGLYVYCKSCVKEKSRERYLRDKDKINAKNRAWKEANKGKYLDQQRDYAKAYGQSLDGKFVQYKTGAKRRNYPFELSKEEFSAFWQVPCHYCGSPIDTI